MECSEILYDHYKETMALLLDKLKERNKFFLLFFLNMAIQFIFTVAPDSITTLLIDGVKQAYEIDISNQLVVVQSILWLTLLYFTMRYYGAIIYIENQYKYLHILEHDLSNTLKIKLDREGKNYLTNYPKMNDMIDFLYKWMFPILYCLIVILKLFTEILHMPLGFILIFDLSVGLCCLILTALYLIHLHSRKQL